MWGLVLPGKPVEAAELARRASVVTHDGNAVFGGMFVAACVSAAFTEKTIRDVIEAGLGVIPVDCLYAEAVRAVSVYYAEHPENWRGCLDFIRENWGSERFSGAFHVIPNAAIMALAMLYGVGKTLCICNMCGWDTDCNVGNVATILGVLCGIDGINYEKWQEPVHDLQRTASVIGSLKCMDNYLDARHFPCSLAHTANET